MQLWDFDDYSTLTVNTNLLYVGDLDRAVVLVWQQNDQPPFHFSPSLFHLLLA